LKVVITQIKPAETSKRIFASLNLFLKMEYLSFCCNE